MNKRRWITLLAALAALLVVAAAALAPRLVLSAQEGALLEEAHAYPGATGQMDYTFPVQDIPVVQSLYAAEEVTNWGEPEYAAKQSREAVAELLPRVEEYCVLLAEAGVLPYELLDYFYSEIFPRDALNFTHYYERNGYEVITCNFGMGTVPPFYFSYTIDMATGLIIRAEYHMPPEAPYLPELLPEVAGAWLGYLGLEAAGDWAAFNIPVDVAAEEAGIYSDMVHQYSTRLRVVASAVWYMGGGANGLYLNVDSFHLQSDDWWAEFVAGDGVTYPAGDAVMAESEVAN